MHAYTAIHDAHTRLERVHMSQSNKHWPVHLRRNVGFWTVITVSTVITP